MKDKLSDRHAVVIEEYFANGFKRADAMRSVGYSEVYIDRNQRSVFQHPAVMAEINRRKSLLTEKKGLTAEWILDRLMALGDAGKTLAKFKKVQPDGTLAWDFTHATEEDLSVVQAIGVDYYTEGRGPDAVKVKKFRIKEPDVQAALVALGRTLAMFTDNVEVSGDLATRLQEGQKRAYQRNRKDKEADPNTVH